MGKIKEGMHLAYGGISIVNAVPCGNGAVMPIDLKVYAREGKSSKDSSLTIAIKDYIRKKYNILTDFYIESEIPEGMGLKSSSAVSVAAISSIANKIGNPYPPYLSAKISKEYGLSITGAFDDAVASYTGMISFTNNYSFNIVKLEKNAEELKAIILIKESRHPINLDLMRKRCNKFNSAYKMALEGRIYDAMILNGKLMAEINGYSLEIIDNALKKGALSAGISGNGPSYFALTKNGEEGSIIDLFSTYGKLIVVDVLH
ncbi:MAG: shikimate kinase [Caldisphaera sp.]